MRRLLAAIHEWWGRLGPWEGAMPQPGTTRIGPPPEPRTMAHIEADLAIQGVIVARSRLRHSYDLEADIAKLDDLIDEWKAAKALTDLEPA